MSKNPDADSGFTLTEVILVVTLLGILSLAVFTVFKGAFDSWSLSEARTQSFENARTALEQMAGEIRCALVNDRLSASDLPLREVKERCDFVGFGRDAPPQVSLPGPELQNNDMVTPSGWRTNSGADEVYFIAALNPGEDAEGELCEAGYFLDNRGTADAGDDVLRRFYVPNKLGSVIFDFEFDTPAGNGNADVVAEGVVDFRVWYWDGRGKDADGDGAIDISWEKGEDDDGDDSVDEEYENGIDDDGDTFPDEDLGWQNSWDSRRGMIDTGTYQDSYNGAQSDGREKGRLPAAVKIQLTVKDEFARMTRTFSTVVYLTNYR